MPERQPIVIPPDFGNPSQSIVVPSDSPPPPLPADISRVSRLVAIGVTGPIGPTGPMGPPGTSFEVIAGQTLSGHRVVRPQSDGSVVYASNDDLADAGRPLWLTLGAALIDESVTVISHGLVIEPSWSWTDDPIYLDVDGLLTQTPPTAPAAFLIQLAASDSPTSLFYEPRTPIAVN